MSTHTLRVVRVVDGTTVDGPGLRTSIYFAGCHHQCPGCHNPQTWPDDAGEDVAIDELLAHVEENEFNVTFTGGDPLYQPRGVAELVSRLKERGINVWLYTGFTYEQVMAQPELARAIAQVDVLVDGPYVEALRDPELLFRGSSNQRLIDISRSTPDRITLLDYRPMQGL